MTARTVAEIDRAIDAVYDELKRRSPTLVVGSVLSWYTAWAEHPDLRWLRERLMSERHDAFRAGSAQQ